MKIEFIKIYKLLAKKEYDKLIIFAINRRQRRNI
ncbi:hypothetical protein JOD41_001220 [Peptoniphilus gorbachii]|uniref:Uncharacterized protein n=1 Tax=Peptoniphilus gorbachii TaxID=411567 RepID=A0ABS2MKE5_9FIRM|nr:hypothetical protein [Peptoniphilus gorbachii]